MIPYLVVTSVLNIAVGYALAVYLGKARFRATTDESAAANETTELPRSITTFSPPVTSEPVREAVAAARPTADSRSTVAATLSPVDAHADVPYAPSELMEQELLAGIEEFRHQLSQLKGVGVPGVFLDPLTAK